MQPAIQLLAALKVSLHEALARKDWEAISELDQQCRTLIGEAADDESWEDPAQREQVEDLVRLYAELQQAARADREQIAGELTRLNQSKQVNQAYKPLG